MRRFLVVLLILLTLTVPAQAVVECPDPARPIHYSPYCLSETEWLALTATPTKEIAPTASYEASEALVRVIAYYFWPDWAAERMIRIAECETVPDWNPYSLNPSSGAAGVWQIMPFWQKTWPGDYFDPWTNGAVAYQIWLSQGFSAWVCKG